MRILISILIFYLTFSSCSTLKKQKFYTGLAGAVILGSVGAELGKSFSPNDESNRLNQMMGFGIGLPLGFMAGSYIGEIFWEEDKKVIPPKTMLDLEGNKNEDTVKTKIKILRPKDVKKIKLESDMPKFLKGKIKEANVLSYDIEEYEEETEDGRKIYHTPHKAFEYVLE